jgi:hypothetical protein
MTIEDEFAKEIAKQLPLKAAYEDAVQPAARQTGEMAEDLVKVVRLALFPVQLLAAAQDRFRKFVKSAVDRVPSEKRIPPAPEIVGSRPNIVCRRSISSVNMLWEAAS